MSTYIPLGKNPESPEERQRLLAERDAREERLSLLELTHVQRRVVDFLIAQKGYSEEEIETNKGFSVELPEGPFEVKADIMVKAGGVRFMLIKCVLNSLESWERHSIAFCRVVEPYQIPYAVVTDGESARVIRILEHGAISEGLDAIPSKQEAGAIVRDTVLSPYPEGKRARERRILYAFDAIKCPTNLNEEGS